MLPGRPGPLVACLLLGLLLLRLPPVRNRMPEAVKAGVCPPQHADKNCEQNCTLNCSGDEDCQDNLKCCRAGCDTFCLMPNEKEGSCPLIHPGIPMLGLCFNECTMDSECSGRMKCCLNGCGKVSCVTPNF
ncbi:WAP four-disulfide core domain protein 2 [Choloepus didactylus]|uniref:WAP four-disulfide core domain protein 2 n=1 Tax=Choloepus didactylus TaxID=27675 RepID=UPI0018A04774|nr:WAP four-disulfide core domain protein 2 [Choloepus didactylus]